MQTRLDAELVAEKQVDQHVNVAELARSRAERVIASWLGSVDGTGNHRGDCAGDAVVLVHRDDEQQPTSQVVGEEEPERVMAHVLAAHRSLGVTHSEPVDRQGQVQAGAP